MKKSGQKGGQTGGRQDWRKSRPEAVCRTEWIQERTDVSECGIGWKLDRRDGGKLECTRRRKGGMQHRY